MKKKAQRSTLPFDNRNDGWPSITPTTIKSTVPFAKGYTIDELLRGKSYEEYQKLHGGGSWSEGYEEKSYREEGDDFMRVEKDNEILKKMMTPTDLQLEKWEVIVDGGTVRFVSLNMAQDYVRKLKLKDGKYYSISRIASFKGLLKNSQSTSVISQSLKKCFMVESLDFVEGVRETGSCFCVTPRYFITCAHVVKKYNKNVDNDKAMFFNTNMNLVKENEKYNAVLVDVDLENDLALLESDAPANPFVVSDGIAEVGTDVIAIGSPHGFENNVSDGIVGSVDKKIYFYEGAPNYMFVDSSVFPGSSGGPVINKMNGEVVGIVSLIVADVGSYGLNAALPSSYVKKFFEKSVANI